MKNIFKNFWVTLTRFKIASLLNIVGLSIAFSIVTIIGIQYNWEMGFNSSIEHSNRIYRPILLDEGEYWDVLSPQMIDVIGQSNPDVESYTLTNLPRTVTAFLPEDANSATTIRIQSTSTKFPETMSLKLVEGDFADYNRVGTTIIPQSYAKRLFGDKSAIGQSILIDDRERSVVAVFEDLADNTILRNIAFAHFGDLSKLGLGQWSFNAYYKLKDGYNLDRFIENSNEQLMKLVEGKDLFYTQEPQHLFFESFNDIYFSEYVDPYGNFIVCVLLLCVGLVLVVIAIINYFNFFMALLPTRIRAVNISKVFGAYGYQLKLNILCESVMFMVLSYAISILLTSLASKSDLSSLIHANISVADNISNLGLGITIAATVGVFVALYPSYYITKFSPALVLKGSFGRNRSGRLMRQTLTALQFTFSFVFATTAIFMLLQNKFIENYDYGFDRENIIITYPKQSIIDKWDVFESEIAKHSDILSVGLSTTPVITDGYMYNTLTFEGEDITFFQNIINERFIETVGLEIVEGRNVADNNSKYEVVINQTMKRMNNLELGDVIQNDYEVVGVVRDYSVRSLHTSVEPSMLQKNISSSKNSALYAATFKIRDGVPTQEAMGIIHRTLDKIDPTANSAERRTNTMEEHIDSMYSNERNLIYVATIVSIAVFLISLMGAFGMTLFDMQYRVKEIAIRKVYGSSVVSLLMRFNRQIVVILLGSFVVSIPISNYMLGMWQASFAYSAPLSWWVFALVAVLMTTIVVGTITVQCYISANSNPSKSLKSE